MFFQNIDIDLEVFLSPVLPVKVFGLRPLQEEVSILYSYEELLRIDWPVCCVLKEMILVLGGHFDHIADVVV